MFYDSRPSATRQCQHKTEAGGPRQARAADALLTQRIRLPLSGHFSQTLTCDEFTVTLDLSYVLQNREAIAGGVSSSYSSGNGLPMQSHGNCFGARLAQPVYMGYVKTGATSYLVIGRFSLAADTKDSQP